MIASIILHQMRVYFTGAYRRPREINWLIGMSLLMCTLLTGFTGYSLVFEQLSFWGATVAGNISQSVPLIGPLAQQMLLAGDSYNEHTLPRFFILHAAVLPTTIIILVVIHIALIRLHGVTEFHDENEPEDRPRHFNFFPDHIYTELIMGLTLMLILSALATVDVHGHARSPGCRPVDHAGRDQARVVFLRFVPLVETLLAHVRRS